MTCGERRAGFDGVGVVRRADDHGPVGAVFDHCVPLGLLRVDVGPWWYVEGDLPNFGVFPSKSTSLSIMTSGYCAGP